MVFESEGRHSNGRVSADSHTRSRPLFLAQRPNQRKATPQAKWRASACLQRLSQGGLHACTAFPKHRQSRLARTNSIRYVAILSIPQSSDPATDSSFECPAKQAASPTDGRVDVDAYIED
jgi:hypothetical protein